MGFHNLIAKLGQSVTKMLDHNTAYGIQHSMSRPGTPKDNGAMESINGWMKAEIFTDLHVTGNRPVKEEVDEYITFFNEERPAYALNYMTPVQYREIFA